MSTALFRNRLPVQLKITYWQGEQKSLINEAVSLANEGACLESEACSLANEGSTLTDEANSLTNEACALPISGRQPSNLSVHAWICSVHTSFGRVYAFVHQRVSLRLSTSLLRLLESLLGR
jgi:hypothetical protein